MDDELKAIVGGEQDTPSEVTHVEEPKVDPEVEAKQTQLANLNKAIEEANANLKSTRKAAKEKQTEEEDIPAIDFEDPSAKAWKREINNGVAPMQADFEKAKDERRTFALRQFLSDKPALSGDSDKLKNLMGTYERIKNASELTTEGILVDLQRAYAAEHADVLLSSLDSNRVEQARRDALFSDAGVSRGATAYQESRKEKKAYTQEELDILRDWERGGAPKL